MLLWIHRSPITLLSVQVEAVILTDTGAPMIADAKRCQKNIVVRSLSESTDVYALAQNIIDRCKVKCLNPLMVHSMPNTQPNILCIAADLPTEN